MEGKYKSEKMDLTQFSIKGQKSLMIEEKTESSAIESQTGQIAETKSAHRKSVVSESQLSPKNCEFQTSSSKTVKVSRILETEKTQSSSYRKSSGNVLQLSTESGSDVEVTTISEANSASIKTRMESSDQSVGKSEE